MVLTFPRSIEAVKNLSNNPNLPKLKYAQLKGYVWPKTAQEASTSKYSDQFNIGYNNAQRHLAAIKEPGLIRDNGEDANSLNYKYVVNE